MPDYAYSVFTCLACIICIPPAYFNWKIPSRPWATLIFIGWIFLLNLVLFMDSIIWSNPDPTTWWDGKVYCDIVSRIKSEFPIGLPGAGIGICRFLADATNPNPTYTSLTHSKFKRNMIDLSLGVLLPVINMGLKQIVNPERYQILGIYGCEGQTDNSWPSVLLYNMWSPILSLIAAIYSGNP
jgi:pheromone a factor receptor